MKQRQHHWLPLLTAALLTAGCASDEASPTAEEAAGQPVTFEATVTKADTRSQQTGKMDGETIQQTGFGVMAAYTKESDYNGEAPDFMYNQQVKYNSGTWTYAPVKYWPNDTEQKISFFAYAPYVGTGNDGALTESATKGITALSANTAAPTLTYTVSSGYGKGVDLLWSNSLKNQTRPTDGKLSFNFRHALAGVRFKVNRAADDAKIAITSATLTAFKMTVAKTATLDLASGEWTGHTGTVDFKPTLPSGGLSLATEAKSLPEEDASLSNNFFLVMPQISSSTPYTLTVSYKMEATIDGTPANINVSNSEIALPYSSYPLEAGAIHTLQVTLGWEGIKIERSTTADKSLTRQR